MLRKVVPAVLVLAFCVGVTLAEDIRCTISKVDGNKVTFAKGSFNKDTKTFEKGEAQTLPVAASVKIVKGTFNKDTKKLEDGDAITDGLKNEMFTKIDEKKGVSATITTDNGTITKIVVGGGRGKGKTQQ